MISTRDLSALPDPAGFRRLMKSLAMLDAILSPEWEYRYYSFDAGWSPGEMMASMRNGSGDQWFAILCREGIALHGLAHEVPFYEPDEPRPWIFRDLPEAFRKSLLEEPAFDSGNSTFCIWRLESEDAWKTGARSDRERNLGDDGSEELLTLLQGDPEQYIAFAGEYYEAEISLDDVRAPYAHAALTPELVSRLNPEADFEALQSEMEKIGYPDSRD